MTDDDLAEGFRNLSHILQSGLFSHQEFDPDRPVFHRIVSPTRSFTGDNADAVYFEAPVAAGRRYVVRGNLAGAVYTSFTMEAGAATAGTPPPPPACCATTTSMSTPTAITKSGSAAASQTLHVPINIDVIDRPPPPPRWNDQRVAAALQRVVNHVRTTM